MNLLKKNFYLETKDNHRNINKNNDNDGRIVRMNKDIIRIYNKIKIISNKYSLSEKEILKRINSLITDD